MELNSQIGEIAEQIQTLSSFKNELLVGQIIMQENHLKVGEGSGVVVLNTGERFHFYVMKQELHFITADTSMHELLFNSIGERIKTILSLSKQIDALMKDLFEM